MFYKFLDHIEKQVILNNTEINNLRDHVKIKFYKKNETILSAGATMRNMFYVLNGCVRIYYNMNGKDKTAFFYSEGDFIWNGKSSINQIPSQKNYEAIEDTVLVQINKKVAHELKKTSVNFALIARHAIEQELIDHQQLIEYFITLSPEERFIRLLETNKSLFQRVPQQYIASYIGVSAETLSRIKRRVHNKHQNNL